METAPVALFQPLEEARNRLTHDRGHARQIESWRQQARSPDGVSPAAVVEAYAAAARARMTGGEAA